MLPYITIFGRSLSMYGIMAAVGIIAGLNFVLSTHKKWTESEKNMEMLILVIVIGGLLGSKVLYLLTVLPQFISDFHYLFTNTGAFLSAYLGGGFVFYGGYYGALLGVILYVHFHKMNIWEVSRVYMPCVPLFHIFGRIGCFLAGCCYGIESESFGITYTESLAAPNGVPLLPVQLMEAFAELVLFLLLWYFFRNGTSGRIMFSVWMIAYGCVRFTLEFFRGDEYRGFIGPLSVSQVFAIFSIIFGVIVLALGDKLERKPTDTTCPV